LGAARRARTLPRGRAARRRPAASVVARTKRLNWSGAKAADLFYARHADWHPAAQRQWERLTGDRGAG